MSSFEQLHRFLFDQVHVRGELVQLQQSFREMLGEHDYPAPVQRLLGELMATTSLLTATLKFEGSITVQLQGNGPVRLAVINGDHKQKLRGVARYQGDIADGNLHDLVGKGHLVITITPDQGERYQGVVGLEGETLSECIEHYFARSEQLPTRLWLKTGEIDGAPVAAGLLLQVLPDETDAEGPGFEHLITLTETLTAEEMFTLPAGEILHRLYHQEDLQVFEPQQVRFFCGCSRERSANALSGMDKAELMAIAAEEGAVHVNCEYCGASYIFDPIDIEALFSTSPATKPTSH